MSRLDQAFIRAFHESADTARARATAPPIPPAPGHSMPRDPRADYAGTIDVDSSTAVTDYDPPFGEPAMRFEQPRPQACFPAGERLTPAHIPSRAEKIAAQAAARTRTWTPHAAHTAPQQATFVPAPVLEFHLPEFREANPGPAPTYGSYIGKLAPAAEPAPQAARPFRATFEVENFAWLPLIDNLCRRQQTGFDRVLLELETEFAAGRNVVALTSVTRGEGRTVMTQCLAKRAVQAGLSVCVVDFDEANPTLADALGLAVDAGWEQVLNGKPLCDSVIESVGDGISAVVLKHPLAAETIASRGGECAAWLEKLRGLFDVVLLDTSPVDPDLGLPADLPIDGWLVVRDVRTTGLPELARWQRSVAAPGVNLLGVLENRADEMPPLAMSG